uniref:Uncharacterized protein n=1 Tax=Cacopsylla melanoneura TaxID=428564 RepID=A0A8D9FKS3_9HEMI
MKSGVTLATDHLITVVFLSQDLQSGFNDSSTKTEHQVKGGLFLNVVVGQSSSIFQLFSGKDQSLLVGRDSLLVLDLSLDIFNSVTGLNLKGDGLPCQGFDKDLHDCVCSLLFLRKKDFSSRESNFQRIEVAKRRKI